MNTLEQIKRHQDAIKLLEAIEYFEKEMNEYRHFGKFGRFAFSGSWYDHRIDICTRCIKRLTERYNRLYNPNT